MHNGPPLPDRKTLRIFGLMMAGMIVLFFGFLIPWLWDRSWPLWPWLVSALFAVTGLVLPMALGPLYRVWMKIGLVLGWVNSRIILGVVFYGLLLPMGLVMRLFGNDPMRRQLQREQKTYRVPSKQASREQMERPY